MLSIYITHPEVHIDPKVAMPRWGLSETGSARTRVFAERKLMPENCLLASSTERKALETAEILAEAGGFHIESHEDLGENDRSSTGYLAPHEFEAHVDALFGDPDRSVNGWETAADAQARVVRAVQAVLDRAAGPVAFIGHGCVGTLLKCHVGGRSIARREDQREMAWSGGGNIFVFDFAAQRLVSDWQSFEDFPGLPNA